MSAGWVAIRGSNNIICFIFKILKFYPQIFTIGIFNIVFLNGFKVEEWFQSGRMISKWNEWFQSAKSDFKAEMNGFKVE